MTRQTARPKAPEAPEAPEAQPADSIGGFAIFTGPELDQDPLQAKVDAAVAEHNRRVLEAQAAARESEG